jgi:signal transduction histidine kinase
MTQALGSGGEAPPRSTEAEAGILEPEALGAWREVEALLRELVERSAPDEVPPPPGDAPGPTGLTATEVLRACRSRLASVRDAARALEGRLSELQRQQDEVLSIVAHDLRTPLVAIQGFSQLLRATGGLSEKQESYVERILQAVRAMNRMVEDLRTARRLDQGRLSLEPRPLDLEALARDLVEMHREEARQKEVALRLEAPEGLPRIVGDPERLAQAVGNLLQNAVKFTPRGSEVVLRVRCRGGMVRWEVTDQGPGFDEALLSQLFHRFAQGRAGEAAGSKGFGLGLYICREIVALHAGRVGARNEPGGGSTFWAEIPLVRPEAADARLVSSPHAAVRGSDG